MSVLTKPEILKALKKKTIKVTPLKKENIGPASVDLTLSNEFRTFKKGKTIDVKETTDYKKVTTLKKQQSITLKPGELILGITKEKISLPNDICGRLTGRSRFARLGLTIHLTAPFMQPGIANRQVLEIANLSTRPLRLHAGTKICQFIFEKTLGEAKYSGKFKGQSL